MSEIVQSDDVLHGYPRIAGTRVGVLQIYERVVENGVDPLQVAREYDLEPADVYQALAYYYDHAEEMRELHRERKQVIAESRAESGPRPGEGPRHAAQE